MLLPEPERPALIRRADGYTDAERARTVRRNEPSEFQRGTYTERFRVATHGSRRQACAGRGGDDRRERTRAIVGHQSAAVLHHLPVWGIRLGRVHILRPHRVTSSSRRSDGKR